MTIAGTSSLENILQGNYIGIGADGTTPLGNAKRGVSVLGANRNLIGGETRAGRNVIGHSGLEGVWLASTFGAFGVPGTNNRVSHNLITRNAGAGVTLLGPNVILYNDITHNSGISIDRGGDGPTPNVEGGEHNYPVLIEARAGSILVTGFLRGRANCKHTVQIFQDDEYVGEFEITTDSAGWAEFQNRLLPDVDPVEGAEISATATSYCGVEETSEEGVPVHITFQAATRIDIEKAVVVVNENETKAIITLHRSGDTTEESIVVLSPVTGTAVISSAKLAVQGTDFVFSAPEIVFAPGQSTATYELTLMNDQTWRNTRHILIQASNPINADLGRSQTLVIILDDDAPPALQAEVTYTFPELKIAVDPSSAAPVLIQKKTALPGGGWFTIGAVIENSQFSEKISTEEDLAFFRLAIAQAAGQVEAVLSGFPQDVALTIGGESVPDFNRFSKPAPAGLNEMVLKRQVTLLNPATGQPKAFINKLAAIIDVEAEKILQFGMKVAMEGEAEVLTPACASTPWCGVAGGVIADTQIVTVSGGANGFSLEEPVVTVTGPNGISMTLKPNQRHTFEPAADGVWRVTSTVCGQTKSCQITLP